MSKENDGNPLIAKILDSLELQTAHLENTFRIWESLPGVGHSDRKSELEELQQRILQSLKTEAEEALQLYHSYDEFLSILDSETLRGRFASTIRRLGERIKEIQERIARVEG